MANQDRQERYSKIRSLLDFPNFQKPTPHQIVNQMFISEQTLALRLTNSRQPWHLISSTINTVAGTSEYTIAQPVSDAQNSGKVYFVVRATGDADLPYLEVPFDDFSELNYGKLPEDVNNAFTVPEKISFYRTDMRSQSIKAVIQPVPQEVLAYTVYFFTGGFDRAAALPTQTGLVAELDDYLALCDAAALLPYAEWGTDEAANDRKRSTLMAGIGFQLEKLEQVVTSYIKNINSPKSFDMDHWNE